MNIRLHHHIFHGRFMYIHTFFHRKIMCSRLLRTCLYDIRQTSYERRLHHSYVALPEPIWAEFAPTIGKIYLQLILAATSFLSRPVCLRRATAIIYRHILLGENSFNLIHTHTWENAGWFFPRRAIICTVYCWEKCKKCKVRSYLCALDPSIFYFIWVKYYGKIW